MPRMSRWPPAGEHGPGLTISPWYSNRAQGQLVGFHGFLRRGEAKDTSIMVIVVLPPNVPAFPASGRRPDPSGAPQR